MLYEWCLKGEESKKVILSTKKMKQRLKHGDPTFITSLLEVNDDLVYKIPNDVSKVLKEAVGFV